MTLPEGLVALEVAKPWQLIWAHGPRTIAYHLYQHGLVESVWNDYPRVEPLCGAPGFDRAGHTRWTDGPDKGGYRTYFEDYVLEHACHACIVTVVTRYPQIFGL